MLEKPLKIITWKDKEDTGATGWIVIHNKVNGVSGGGLFMHPQATLGEVQDLASTMSLKNSLQTTIFGGGKGGIRFDPKDPRSDAVLKRFLKDNSEIIKNEWCTGGDLNTTTKGITQALLEVSDLQSPFHSLANMLQKHTGREISLDRFKQNLQSRENYYFTLEDMVTGYSLLKAVEKQTKGFSTKPKIIIQGFGKVGKAFCFYAQKYYSIVGICEENWFIYDPNGINIEPLLDNIHNKELFGPITKQEEETEEMFLIRFLNKARADLFCPCAVRYCITEKVLDALINETFSENFNKKFIVSGANDVFKEKALIYKAIQAGVVVMPEWLSNSGSALLFMEALKHQDDSLFWNEHMKNKIEKRIYDFIEEAEKCICELSLSFYDACYYLAKSYLKNKERLSA